MWRTGVACGAAIDALVTVNGEGNHKGCPYKKTAFGGTGDTAIVGSVRQGPRVAPTRRLRLGARRTQRWREVCDRVQGLPLQEDRVWGHRGHGDCGKCATGSKGCPYRKTAFGGTGDTAIVGGVRQGPRVAPTGEVSGGWVGAVERALRRPMREGAAGAHSEMAPREWELPKAEGEAVRRPRLAGLGASPSVAARQVSLGRPARKSHCSDLPCRWWCHEVTVGSFRYPVRRRPEPPSACGISPRGAGERGNGDYAQVSSGGAIGSGCSGGVA